MLWLELIDNIDNIYGSDVDPQRWVAQNLRSKFH